MAFRILTRPLGLVHKPALKITPTLLKSSYSAGKRLDLYLLLNHVCNVCFFIAAASTNSNNNKDVKPAASST